MRRAPRSPLRLVGRSLLALFLVGMAIWILLDLNRRGEKMAHESLHWASGFAIPVVEPPSGIATAGAFSEGYTSASTDVTVHVTSTTQIDAPEVRVFRDRELCGDQVWPYPQGGGPSGLGDALVWLEGITSGSVQYPMDQSISNGGCYLYPNTLLTGVGSTLVLENYLYTQEVFRASLLDDGQAVTLDQWSMGDMDTVSYQAMRHELRLDEAGLLKVQSLLRPWEIAFVLVCEHAYCGSADWEGKVYFTGVPDGDYTLHAWHYRTGEITQPIQVGPQLRGRDVTINFP